MTASPAALLLAEFATALRIEDVPVRVLDSAKLHLLDTIGCGLAAGAMGVGGEGRAAFTRDGGVPESTVIGSGTRIPAARAAFANAMLCHALDFDDTHAPSIAHMSVTAGPAALALGEAQGRSGEDILLAFIAASEVTSRVGAAASGQFHAHGLHPTSVCGVFGVAAAASRLLGLTTERTASALGLAGSMSSGLLAFLDEGTPTKPVHAGLAAQNGILAAVLSGEGAEGPLSVLEGRFGIYRALLGLDIDPAAITDGLGERWETETSAYKAYPACHLMHGALGAVAELAADVGDVNEIESVTVTVAPSIVAMVLEPTATKMLPRSDYEAKFSLQFSAASMLVHGRVGLGTYEPASLADERVLALARLVRYDVRDFPTAGPAFPGAVTIRLRSGRTLEAELAYQRGAPENPLTPEEVRAKFRENAARALTEDVARKLEGALLSLEELSDPGDALSLLAHQPEGARA